MELKELSEKTLEIFGISKIDNLGDELMRCALSCDVDKYSAFVSLAEDLTVDWLQKIYQYYQADRKDKKQDYTPKSLAEFMSLLCGSSATTIDMCAGSGALAIQRWNQKNTDTFTLYEIDSNVIPYLIFNMAVRNVQCIVLHADVLKDELFGSYQITKGEKYSTVKEDRYDSIIDF